MIHKLFEQLQIAEERNLIEGYTYTDHGFNIALKASTPRETISKLCKHMQTHYDVLCTPWNGARHDLTYIAVHQMFAQCRDE